jgi:hypothetical protein
MTRTHARFYAPVLPPADETPYAAGDLWPQPDGPVPLGKPFARRLDAAVQASGWHVDYRWSTDYSHAFDARRQKDRFDVMVELLDEDTGHYKVTVSPRTGLFAKMFGKGTSLNELRRLALDVHSVLGNDPDVEGVLWFEGDTATDGSDGP